MKHSTTRRFALATGFLAALSISSVSLATVVFKEGPFVQFAEVGSTVKLNMETLLLGPVPKNIYWLVKNVPSWLRYDKSTDQYLGKATCKDLGLSNLEISAVEPGVNAAKAKLELNVFSDVNCAPQWYDEDQLDEYQLPADQPIALEFKKADFLKRAYDPEGKPLQITFGPPPQWLSVTQGPNGDSIFLSGSATKEQLLQDFKLEVLVSDGQATTTGYVTLTLYIQ
jgi:hypothetical protein